MGESLPVETGKQQQGPKKRGRPGKRDSKDWQDDEISMLINLWPTKEELFTCRNDNYQNRDNRLNQRILNQRTKQRMLSEEQC